MAFVGNLLTGKSGAKKATIQTPTNAGQATEQYGNVNAGLNQQQSFLQALQAQNGLGNQSSVFNQLQAQANGTGPSVAQTQLNQATGQNVANQAALAAGQRGSSANAGLMARQAGMQGANIQQNAAGQAATLRANETTNALGQMGSLANQQVNQQQTGLQNYSNTALNAQSNVLNGIAGQNSAAIQNQAGVNSADAQFQSAIIGGIAGGAGAALTAGGNKKVAAAHGAIVPGEATVPGDSPVNDTVQAILSPGEIVIPRSIAEHPNAPEMAAAFIQGLMKTQGDAKKKFAEGGVAVADPDLAKTREIYNIKAAAASTPSNPLMAGFDDTSSLDSMFSKDEAPKSFNSSAWSGAENSMAMQKEQDLRDQSKKIVDIDAILRENQVRGRAGLTPLAVPEAPQISGSATPAQQVQTVQQGMHQAPLAAGASTPVVDPLAPKVGAGQSMMIKGVTGMRDAEMMKADQQLEAAKNHETQVKQMQGDYDAQLKTLNGQREILQKQLATREVDPDRYINNMTLGRRVSTGIGLILGGIGGSLTGKENPALQMLNQAIDHDVNAQKANIDKDNNLLSQNLKQYGNLNDAMAATRAMTSEIFQAKLTQAAAQAANPEAKARADIAIGTLRAQTDQQMQGIAKSTAVNNAIRNGGYVNPALLSADERERQVPGYGLASTKEAAKEANTKVATFNNINSGINQLLQFSSKGSSLSLSDRAKAGTIAGMLKGNLRVEIVGPGAVSESERAMIDAIVANPLEITRLNSTSRAALGALMERVSTSLDNNVKQFGLQPKAKIQETPRR